MKRLLLALLLAAAAFFAYRQIVLEAPVRAYRRFARAWAAEDTPAAAALTAGDAARREVESRILRGVVRAPMEALRGDRSVIESREAGEDGTVVVTALQFVRFDPPGITSGIGGAAEAEVRHVARMKKTAEGWRVAAWKPEFLTVRPARPR